MLLRQAQRPLNQGAKAGNKRPDPIDRNIVFPYLCHSLNEGIIFLLRITVIMDKLIYLVPIMGVIGLLYTFVKFNWVSKQNAGNEKMQEISKHIADGAMAFLKAEWKILGYFVVIVAILLGIMS